MKTICFGIGVMICQPLETVGPVDSFCQLYTQVIVNKGDGTIQAPLEVKKRIIVNERLYRKVCSRG